MHLYLGYLQKSGHVEFWGGVEFGKLELGSFFFQEFFFFYIGRNPNFEVELWRKLASKRNRWGVGKEERKG